MKKPVREVPPQVAQQDLRPSTATRNEGSEAAESTGAPFLFRPVTKAILRIDPEAAEILMSGSSVSLYEMDANESHPSWKRTETEGAFFLYSSKHGQLRMVILRSAAVGKDFRAHLKSDATTQVISPTMVCIKSDGLAFALWSADNSLISDVSKLIRTFKSGYPGKSDVAYPGKSDLGSSSRTKASPSKHGDPAIREIVHSKDSSVAQSSQSHNEKSSKPSRDHSVKRSDDSPAGRAHAKHSQSVPAEPSSASKSSASKGSSARSDPHHVSTAHSSADTTRGRPETISVSREILREAIIGAATSELFISEVMRRIHLLTDT